MKNRLFSVLLASAFIFSAALAAAPDAKTCRDASGKFMKCPAMPPAPAKPLKCRDAAGKFTKCITPDAKPVQ